MNTALLSPGPGGAHDTPHFRTPRASYPGALSASSMLWVAFFVVARAMLSLLPVDVSPPVMPGSSTTIVIGPTMVPPPLVPTPPRPTVAPRVTGSGIVIPAPVPDAPPSEAPFSIPQAPEAGGRGESPEPGSPDVTGDSPAPAPAPTPGTYVPHDVEPEALVRIEPEYPDLAREAGIEGAVTLLVLVGVSGRVEDVRVLRSAPVFDAAAIEALRRWVFRPALAGTHPVAVWVAIPVRFTLHGR